MTYHTLVGIRRSDNRAEIIFGDPSRQTVKSEMDDYRDTRRHEGRQSHYLKFAILETVTDDQSEIVSATADWELTHRQSLPVHNPSHIRL